jgi:hypothetical protein
MNEICPFCFAPQRFPISYINTVVCCQKCAKPFLLSRGRRDRAPRRRWSDPEVREFLEWMFFTGGSIIFVLLILVLLS